MSLLMIIFLIISTGVSGVKAPADSDSLEVKTTARTTSGDKIVYSYGMDNYSVGFNKNSISTNIVEENIDVSSGLLTLNIKLTSLPMRGNKTYDVYLTYRGSPISVSEVFLDDYGWHGWRGVEEQIDDNECIINADMGNCGLGWNIMPGEFSFRDWPVPRASAGGGVVYEGFLNLNGGRSYSMLSGGSLPHKWYTVDKREDLLLDGSFHAGEGYNCANLYTPEYDYFFGEYGIWPDEPLPAWNTGSRIFVLLTKITDKNGNQVTVDWHEPEYASGYGVVITSNRIPEKITTPTDECNIYRQEIIPDGSLLWNFYTIERLEEDINGDLFTVRFYYEKANLPDAFEYWYGHEVVLLDSIAFLKNGTKVKPSYRFFYDSNNGELTRFITPDGAEYSYEYESVEAFCWGSIGGRTEYRRIKRKEVFLPETSGTLVYEYHYKGGTDLAASSVGEKQSQSGNWSLDQGFTFVATYYPMYRKCKIILPEGDSVVYWNIDSTFRAEQLERDWGGWSPVYPDYLGSFYGKPYRIVTYDRDDGAVKMERLYWTMSEEVNRDYPYYYHNLHPVLRYKITQKNPDNTIVEDIDENLILYEYTKYDKYDNKKKYKFLGEIEYIGTEAVTVEYNEWETWTDKKGRLLYNDKDPEDSWVVEQEFKHEDDTTYIREVFDCGVGCVQVREHLLVHLLTSKGKYTISGEKIDSTELEYDLYLTEDFSFVPIPLFDKENYGRDFNIRGNLNKKTEWINEDETRSQEYRYDFCGNLRRMEDYRGHDYIFWYCFPANVFPLDKYYPHGLKEHLYFDNEGNLIEFKDMNNISRNFDYDCFGRLTSDRIGDDWLNEYKYDDFNRIAKAISFSSATSSDTTIYYYDNLGRLEMEEFSGEDNSKDVIKEYFYDRKGNLNKETIPRFSSAVVVDTVKKKFDVLGRVTEVEYPKSSSPDYSGPEIVEYEYNRDITDVKDEEGYYTTLINDASGNLIEVEDALGYYTDYYYDVNGNLKEIEDADVPRKSTYFEYDWLGNLVRREGPDRGVDTFAYDASGNTIYHKLNSGDEIEFTYDQIDRITSKSVNDVESESYYYDSYTDIGGISYTPPSGLDYPEGRLTGFQNANVVEVYFYDKFGNLGEKWVIPFKGDSEIQEFEYSYDLQGRLTRLIYPNGYDVEYEYDKLGNISSVELDNDKTVNLSSTAAGLLSGIHFPGGVTDTFTYLPRNWMESMEINGIPDPYSREFEYNRRGELRKEWKGDNCIANYNYDALGRINLDVRYQEGAYYHNYAYDAVGNRIGMDYGFQYDYEPGTNRLIDDGENTYSYDPNGRLSTMNGGTPSEVNFTYNPEGMLTEISGEENHCKYYYKGLQRIREEKLVGGIVVVEGFIYSCDLKSQDLSRGILEAVFLDANDDEVGTQELGTISGTKDWMEISGNIPYEDLPSGAVSLELYVRREGTSGDLWVGDTQLEEGQWTISDQAYNYFYDNAGNLIMVKEDNSGTGPPTAEYIYAGNRLLAKVEGYGKHYFYHLDRIGSPIMITDEDGNVVREKKYEAFGNLVWSSGTHEDNREFASKEKEPTGFHYFGARRYYANIGRFLSPDPHTLYPWKLKLYNPQTLNPYVYCHNDPVNYFDPTGFEEREIGFWDWFYYIITLKYIGPAPDGAKAIAETTEELKEQNEMMEKVKESEGKSNEEDWEFYGDSYKEHDGEIEGTSWEEMKKDVGKAIEETYKKLKNKLKNNKDKEKDEDEEKDENSDIQKGTDENKVDIIKGIDIFDYIW